MNTLTKNRILQKGDEYRDNGKWKAVPEDNFGLQVMFSGYSEVRQPSETLRETPDTANNEPTEAARLPVSPTPISPKQEMDKSAPPAAAESDKNPVASHSATGDTLQQLHEQSGCTDYLQHSAENCPHLGGHGAGDGMRDKPTYDPTGPAAFPKGPIEKAVEMANQVGKMSSHLKIKFPKGSDCIWTGRNGSFNGYGLDAMTLEDKVMLFPIGKRGKGNCTIQFPTSTIPELVDWLLRQQK